jgi:hypothetical protein
MIEKWGLGGMAEMRQSTSFEFENQQVDDEARCGQFTLDIPWAFTYHTHACAEELWAYRRCVSYCEAWVERDIQENFS